MKATSLIMLLVLLAGCGSSAPPPSQSGDARISATRGGANSAETSVRETPQGDVQLSIVSYEGILEHVSRNRGKVVVMDAWSTSCVPCMKEFPHLVELHKKHGPDQLACISLSFDFEGIGKPEEQQDRVLDFLRKQGATFDNLMSNEESDELYRKFKLASVPAVFVYDQSGQLRKRFDNQKAKSESEHFTYAQVGQLVTELLAEPAPRDAPASPAGQ